MKKDKTEKMTAQISAVDAADEQSSIIKTKEIITESATENNEKRANCEDNKGLEAITMSELYESVYQPKIPIVEGFLNSGTYLFVGAPKVGKSFFMAQLAYHVSLGMELWGYKVRPGTVLYLALEDDYARLQQRLSQMFGVDGSEDLFLATRAKNLNEGLDEQMEAFMNNHPNTRLIIIDTLQKIREVGGDKFSYASDYEIVTKLKSFSDKYNICLLVVHHTRKMESNDSFDMISGTNGLLGAADGAFIMQKKNMKVFQEMQNVKASLDNILRDLRRIENVISVKQEKLDAITGIWKGKEKAALLKEIAELVIKRDDKSLQLDRMVRIAGYKNVQSFITALKKSEKLIEEYLRENPDGIEELQNEKAKSVIDTIRNYQDEAKTQNKRKHNKSKQNEMEIG